MMRNDVNVILDDILARWHAHCQSYSPVPVAGADPMFRSAKTSRHWDELADIADDAVNTAQMKAVDFHVGEMKDPHRTAIHVLARNCHSGCAVWSSPRLPVDGDELDVIVMEARNMLTRKLMAAGVM